MTRTSHSTQAHSTRERLDKLSPDQREALKLLLERKSRRSATIKPTIRATTGEQSPLLPPSYAQQRLWFIDQLEHGSTAYHISAGLHLQGTLDPTALQKALDTLLCRHDALRTVFVSTAEGPKQKVTAPGHFQLRLVDLSASGAQERPSQVLHHQREEAFEPFNLATGPLVRGRLLQLTHDEHVLLITMHHIVADGWSLDIFIRELGTLYAVRKAGLVDPLKPLPIQYPDYASWQQQQNLDLQLEYWRESLKDAPPQLHLPTDRPRPAVQTYHGNSLPVELDTELSGALKALAQKQGLTLFMVLYAGWAILLSRLSGQEDVSIGTPVANRQLPEVEGLVGLFVNTLVLRTHIPGDLPVQHLFEQVKEILLGAYSHQDVPFEQVVEAVQPQRSLSRNPLFQVMFALQNAPRSDWRFPDLAVTSLPGVEEPATFDLLLALEERADKITGYVNYATDLFDRKTIERWMASFKILLRALTDDVSQPAGALPLLPPEERYQVVEAFNGLRIHYPREKLIHELFEDQVKRTPSLPAVLCGKESLTYQDLNTTANQLARYLQVRGICPGARVAISLERSPEMIVALLGVLKCGAAYVPLDPEAPPARRAYLLNDATPALLLTDSPPDAWPGYPAESVVQLSNIRSELGALEDTNIDIRREGVTSENLCYVIYTSGSTGEPKGVVVTHQNLVASTIARWRVYGPLGRYLLLSPLSFDSSVAGIFGALTHSGSLVIATRPMLRDLELLSEAVLQHEVKTLLCVPSLYQRLLALPSFATPHNPLVRAIVAGEACPPPLVTDSARLLPHVTIFNEYGPTEATVWASVYECRDLEQIRFAVPIGKPIANTQIYLLDRRGQPVPIGVTGEIHIGGAGVTRGYLNRPELTSERFLEDPFNTQAGARLYKTGDLARWRPDGNLEYLGRNDDQVKLRGFRIELGEIETQLLRFLQIREASVIIREDHPGEKRLVAYVTSRTSAPVSAQEVRAHLTAVVPDYMIPSAVVSLESLPLTPNGKIDRAKLPAPALRAYVTRQYEAPHGEVEEVLAGIWQDLLRVQRVGAHDNFFELGGHSLLIVQMMERLRRTGLAAEVRQVFESPTLRDLAAVLISGTSTQSQVPPNLIPAECEHITPEMLPLVRLLPDEINRIAISLPGGHRNIQDIYPLTALQEGMLFHHSVSGQRGDAYVLPMLLSFPSRGNLDDFAVALQKVIDRHDALRTAIQWDGLSQPVQIVCRHVSLPVDEIALDSGRDLQDQLQELMTPAHQRLDLSQAPLLRLRVAADPAGPRWYALLQLHHLVCDHESLDIVLEEVKSHLEGKERDLPPPVSFRNHVAQAVARAPNLDAESFFSKKLADIDEPTVPFGLREVHGDGSRLEQAILPLEPTLVEKIRGQARCMGVSAATLFHSAWALVAARASARDDVVFGTVLLGRLQGSAGAQRILGMFLNTLPLRINLQHLTAKQLVERTQRELVVLLQYEQASLAVAQRCSGIEGSAPLFTSLLNYRHSAVDLAPVFANAAGGELLSLNSWTNYPILLSIDDDDHGLALQADTDQRIDAHRVLDYMHTAVLSLIQALEHSPDTAALNLTVLPEAERRRILDSFNATHAAYPPGKLVHELFEEQARRTPGLIALLHSKQQVTYADLNRSANQLAHTLRSRGIGRDDLVAVCLERGVPMVECLLAILKAGAAYLPLDPHYPPSRLRYMLEDAAPRLVVTQETLKALLPEAGAAVLVLDSSQTAVQESSLSAEVRPATPDLTPDSRVYVIYTSGSTGQPKGTEMPHGPLVNLLHWHRDSLPLEHGQRVLQFAALSFDVAFQEIFSTLTGGGTLVLIDEHLRQDPRALIGYLNHLSVNRLFLPPAMLESLADTLAETDSAPSSLTDIITAGEQLRITPEVGRLIRRLPGCRLHNHYGPTETHVVTTLTLTGSPDSWPAQPGIGRPIANTQIYVLNRHQQPVPPGVAGEIYIGGAALARGYLRRPDLTAERFTELSPDTLLTSHLRDRGEKALRLYRTGDLGRYHEDGTLEYLGRADAQVKIRGYRIEPGEIEAQLLANESIREAVVVAREDSPGSKRLVAYVVPRDQDSLQSTELRSSLKRSLPDYMIPTAWVVLSSLPLTPSGKLNRRELPPPETPAQDADLHQAPEGELENTLARIWQEVLYVGRVGRQDDFFDLGGHSLLAMRVIARVRQALDVEITPAELFATPTLEGFAVTIATLQWLKASSNRTPAAP